MIDVSVLLLMLSNIIWILSFDMMRYLIRGKMSSIFNFIQVYIFLILFDIIQL